MFSAIVTSHPAGRRKSGEDRARGEGGEVSDFRKGLRGNTACVMLPGVRDDDGTGNLCEEEEVAAGAA